MDTQLTTQILSETFCCSSRAAIVLLKVVYTRMWKLNLQSPCCPEDF